MSRTYWVVAVILLAAAAPVAARASTVEVRDGALKVVQAPGEPTSVRVLPLPEAAGAWQVSAPRYAFGAGPFAPGRQQWPGTAPGPGAGCAASATPTSTVLSRPPFLRCEGVSRVDLAFGNGPDYAEVLAGPATLAGGGGRDVLNACRVSGAVADGGPGDDYLWVVSGSSAGGPGDDYMLVDSCGSPSEATPRADAVVDCGPGNDVLRYGPDGPEGPQRRIDARTCPPIIRPLRPIGAGNPSLVRRRIPKDYRLDVPLFRVSEAVKGTARLVRFAGAQFRQAQRCSSTARFRSRPGRAVRVTVTISRSLVRRVIKGLGKRFVACQVQISGTDDDGERFDRASTPSMQGYRLDPRGRIR